MACSVQPQSSFRSQHSSSHTIPAQSQRVKYVWDPKPLHICLDHFKNNLFFSFFFFLKHIPFTFLMRRDTLIHEHQHIVPHCFLSVSESLIVYDTALWKGSWDDWICEADWQLLCADRSVRVLSHLLGHIRVDVRALFCFKSVSSQARHAVC